MIGGTYKVSVETLTLLLPPSVLTVSRFVSLAYEPTAVVSPTWLLSGVFGFYTTLLHRILQQILGNCKFFRPRYKLAKIGMDFATF